MDSISNERLLKSLHKPTKEDSGRKVIASEFISLEGVIESPEK